MINMDIQFKPVIESIISLGFDQMCTNAPSCESCIYHYTDELYQCHGEYRKDILQSLEVNYIEEDLLKYKEDVK